ncbi:hypothetical protein [Streptomyces collinus]|uniref:hypothetical protein n=1 Tax=Streptomyces collinus TaxID=42684 RepID=UPI0036E58D19
MRRSGTGTVAPVCAVATVAMVFTAFGYARLVAGVPRAGPVFARARPAGAVRPAAGLPVPVGRGGRPAPSDG